MRILVLSDIHSNLETLEACLEAVPAHDKVANLGDIVGYGGNPNEVTALARKLGGMLVRGNHDKACTGQMTMEDFNPVAAIAALWTMQALTPENLQWLKLMPRGPLFLPLRYPRNQEETWAGTEQDGVQLVHGSPRDEDEYVLVLRDAQESLLRTNFPLTFFGHTHIQGGFAVVDGRWDTLRPLYNGTQEESERWLLDLNNEAKYMINPGSVGQPRDGDPRAAFCVFDSDRYEITFYRVPYDIEKAQQQIIAARLPERLATRLAEGR
jgi:diadenosine tetraphosphatase ApaH/serine/threonine PP2A family protein phosphatase